MPDLQDHNQHQPNAQSQLLFLRALAASGTAGLRTDSQWEAWLHRAERFSRFGFENTMLIWAQAPSAVLLNTYQGWQNLRRQVTAGSAGVRLIAPGKNGAERVVPVFDLLQTEGKPVRLPQPRSALDDIGADGHAWDTLVSLAGRVGFRVTLDMDATGVDWGERAIRIGAKEDRVAVLAHQVSHVLLDHSGPVHEAVCQGLRKVEADSLTFLIQRRFGMDTSAITFPYVTSWAGTDPRTDRARIIGAAGNKITGTATKALACIDASEHASARPVAGPRRALGVAAVPSSAAPVTPQPSAPPLGPFGERPRQLALAQLEALRFFTDQVRRSWVPTYLEGRGLDASARRDWCAGHAPGTWTAVTDHLRKLGFSDDIIIASGLAVRSSRHTLIDVFRDRVMFPVRAADGTVRGFIGRAAPGAGPDIPKYLNSRDNEIYHKGGLLFGLHDGRDVLASGAVPVVVEGPVDAMAITVAAGAGHYVGVAPCGTAFTKEQLGELASVCDLSTTGLIVAFDADEAGQKAAVRAHELMKGIVQRPMAVMFAPGEDPASVLEHHGADALRLVLGSRAHPLSDVIIDHQIAVFRDTLEFTEGKFNALHAVAPVIARMPPVDWPRQAIRVSAQIGFTPLEVSDAVVRAMPETVNDTVSARDGPRPGRAALQAASDTAGPPQLPVRPVLPTESGGGVARRPPVTSAQARRSMQ
jgi:DNA primase